ncbi:hypothetical protein [Georgenia faecalis]|uniref:Glycoside hydrolase family 38 N-terminal domain-containing protein n=1 Tax=Georgenia faecalis TaxID=2483799 RepID=A0ABV9D5G3_9MICO|nr:hypothetical protein [Georgenia faecalis]
MGEIREVLLVGHTHHDVGYTNSPRLVDAAHRRVVGEVLDLCDAHAAPGPDQMRWTFEAARPVLEFVRTAAPRDVERLRALVAAGRVAVTGGYLNMTQLLGEHELDETYDRLGALTDAGIGVRTEQHGDVNGIAWGAVPAMRRAGLDRLVMALNPDHGRPPFTQPTGFWWEGPDGSRVFVWLSTHYGYGEEWGIVDGDVALAEANVGAFVAALEAREDYPYDVAVVHAGNDNRWPTARFLDVVRHWNARHPERPMRTATIDEALDRLVPVAERADVPVVRGEWSDWWSHGHGSTAREVALYRTARSHALTAQASLALAALRGSWDAPTSAVIGYRRAPVRLRTPEEVTADLEAVDTELLLFSEHTWGSWESYSRRDSDFTYSSFNAKAAFAAGAFDLGRDLAVEGLFRLLDAGDGSADPAAPGAGAAPAATTVVVLNPTSHPRTEPVLVEVGGADERVLLARDVPAFGVAACEVPPAAVPGPATRVLATRTHRLVVDPARGGVVSLVHLASGRELVDPEAAHGLGAVVVEQVPAGSDHPMVTVPKAFHPDHPGPDFVRAPARGVGEPTTASGPGWAEITWHAQGPTLDDVTTTVRLYDDVDLVDVTVRLAKPEVREPESVFVTFPFAVTDPGFLLETAGAVYRAGAEQLADTSMDWYSLQHAAAVTGTDGGILWGTLDAPLVQLGAFQTGRWARRLDAPTGHVHSWVMNNLHFTNFRAAQGGVVTLRYRFRAAAAPTPADVRRFGRDLLLPLTAREVPDAQVAARAAALGAEHLHVEPSDAVLADLRPGPDGRSVRVRLRAVGDAVDATFTWRGPGRVVVDGAADGGRVPVPAHGVVDVELRRVQPSEEGPAPGGERLPAEPGDLARADLAPGS